MCACIIVLDVSHRDWLYDRATGTFYLTTEASADFWIASTNAATMSEEDDADPTQRLALARALAPEVFKLFDDYRSGEIKTVQNLHRRVDQLTMQLHAISPPSHEVEPPPGVTRYPDNSMTYVDDDGEEYGL